MEKKDERMKVTTEILNGIKYIKMSGWEKVFLNKVIIITLAKNNNNHKRF